MYLNFYSFLGGFMLRHIKPEYSLLLSEHGQTETFHELVKAGLAWNTYPRTFSNNTFFWGTVYNCWLLTQYPADKILFDPYKEIAYPAERYLFEQLIVHSDFQQFCTTATNFEKLQFAYNFIVQIVDWIIHYAHDLQQLFAVKIYDYFLKTETADWEQDVHFLVTQKKRLEATIRFLEQPNTLTRFIQYAIRRAHCCTYDKVPL